jgi:hypothetical protein
MIRFTDPSDNDDLVLVLTEPDPVLAAAAQSALEKAGIPFTPRHPGLNPTFGGSFLTGGVEFWVGGSDLADARRVLEAALPSPEELPESAPFPEPDLADAIPVLDTWPERDLPTLFWRRTAAGAFLLVGPEAAYARIVAEGGWRKGATVETPHRTWELVATRSFPGRIFVDGYVPGDRLVLDLRGEPAPLVLESTGAPFTSVRSRAGEIWETDDDWVVRLHNASGPKTERWRLEIDCSIAGSPECLLLASIAMFAKRRMLSAALSS